MPFSAQKSSEYGFSLGLPSSLCLQNHCKWWQPSWLTTASSVQAWAILIWRLQLSIQDCLWCCSIVKAFRHPIDALKNVNVVSPVSRLLIREVFDWELWIITTLTITLQQCHYSGDTCGDGLQTEWKAIPVTCVNSSSWLSKNLAELTDWKNSRWDWSPLDWTCDIIGFWIFASLPRCLNDK